MLVCEAEALMKADSSTVWDILTDSSNLPVWESGITYIRGELNDRNAVRLKIGRHGRTLRVFVRQKPPEKMTWTATLPLRLFRIMRTFDLVPHADSTYLKVTDASSGPLSRWYPPATAEDLDNFVDAVRHRAELVYRTQ